MTDEIAFVLSNPRHHAEILLPVVRRLLADGHRCRVVSLAEFRGFVTPAWPDLPAGTVVRVLPWHLRKNPSLGADSELIGPGTSSRRRLQGLIWAAGLGPRLAWLLRRARAVVVPNDAAFPYGHLATAISGMNVPLVLVQEGIRFPLPGERGGEAYGLGGARVVCTWGEGSAEHFRRIGVPAGRVVVTGNPRFDQLRIDEHAAAGEALLARYQLPARPLLYLSNPIDDMGYGSTTDKMALFARFLGAAAAALSSVGAPLLVKLHPREDVEAYRRVVATTALPTPLQVVVADRDVALFPLLAIGRAAVVLASTVGLEAMVFGLPVGVLALPGHGHVFEYVQRGAAVGIPDEGEAASAALRRLLGVGPGASAQGGSASRFVERHLAHRGQAAAHVARVILGTCPGPV